MCSHRFMVQMYNKSHLNLMEGTGKETLSVADLEICFGGPIVFFQVLQHKFLKMGQFINL